METILLKKKKRKKENDIIKFNAHRNPCFQQGGTTNVIGASPRIFLFPGALSIFVIYSSAGEGGCLVGDVTGSYINSLSASHPSFFKGRPGTRDRERGRGRGSGKWRKSGPRQPTYPPLLLHLSCKYTIRPVVQFAKTKQVLDLCSFSLFFFLLQKKFKIYRFKLNKIFIINFPTKIFDCEGKWKIEGGRERE